MGAPNIGGLSRRLVDRHIREPLGRIAYGPLIEGAAYEIMCVAPPSRITLNDGYLTVFFSRGGHFHLCVGESMGPTFAPTTSEVRAHRKPSRAIIYRGLLRDGSPLTWGFEMWNGKNEQMISIFFSNPFITDEDTAENGPALAMAFVVFSALMYDSALVLGGAAGFTVEGMAWVLAVDVVAYAGMLMLHVLLKAIFERTPPSAVPAA